jgi:hypothetical protein
VHGPSIFKVDVSILLNCENNKWLIADFAARGLFTSAYQQVGMHAGASES